MIDSKSHYLPSRENPVNYFVDNWARRWKLFFMALTPSTMLALGTSAPDFRLPDTNGKTVSLADFKDAPALLVVFMCNHCPYVKHIRAGLAALARDYQKRGAAIVGINSNDATTHPGDSPEKMKDEVRQNGYTFPYLIDESQTVAKAYRAACTPDIFLFDKNRKLAYRGQFDGSRPGKDLPVTGKDVRAALDAVLAGKPVPPDQTPSIGCNIKWKPGNEPDYSA
jgi:peroxiredoxin